MRKKELLERKRYKKLTLEYLLKLFYAVDISGKDFGTTMEEIDREIHLPEDYKNQIRQIVTTYTQHENEINHLISCHLIGWRLERIGFLERGTLRIWVSYMLYLRRSLPEQMFLREIGYIISFLLELLECYGVPKRTVKFVHGVISSILKEQTEKVNTKTV